VLTAVPEYKREEKQRAGEVYIRSRLNNLLYILNINRE
jgi:hypothetical protein